MPSVQTFLSRGLTAREIRRMNECKMLPADAVTSQAFIKQLETKFLYHYGCELNEALTEICDSKAIDERPSSFMWRGSSSFFNHYFPFIDLGIFLILIS
jgi:hypothetical protein